MRKDPFGAKILFGLPRERNSVTSARMTKGKRGRTRQNFIKRFFSVLGPGLITGAADDDPSGIATYSIAGAMKNVRLLIRVGGQAG